MAYHVSAQVKKGNEIKTISVSRVYQSKEAATKAGERLLKDLKDSGLTPVGSYILRNSSGKEVRPFMSKEAYNDLYHFINPDVRRSYAKNHEEYRNKVPIISRRYDTLNGVRKAALVQSKREWEEDQYFGRNTNISMEIYKGQKYLGFVTYNILKGKKEIFNGYEGIWSPAGHEKDEQHLKKDGSLV